MRIYYIFDHHIPHTYKQGPLGDLWSVGGTPMVPSTFFETHFYSPFYLTNVGIDVCQS